MVEGHVTESDRIAFETFKEVVSCFALLLDLFFAALPPRPQEADRVPRIEATPNQIGATRPRLDIVCR